jgi:ankyrin repeat protein
MVMQNIRVLFLLLISSICVAQQDCHNLCTAVSKGAVEDVRALLELGVDVNIQDASGATALMYAVNYGRLDCINLLIEKGANPKTRDQHRWTPLLLAEFNADHYGNKAEVLAILKAASTKK